MSCALSSAVDDRGQRPRLHWSGHTTKKVVTGGRSRQIDLMRLAERDRSTHRLDTSPQRFSFAAVLAWLVNSCWKESLQVSKKEGL